MSSTGRASSTELTCATELTCVWSQDACEFGRYTLSCLELAYAALLCYAMSGTETACRATHSLCLSGTVAGSGARKKGQIRYMPTRSAYAICLRICYAKSGTELAYAAMRCAGGTRRTDRGAYGHYGMCYAYMLLFVLRVQCYGILLRCLIRLYTAVWSLRYVLRV
eukprot:3941978-Rhodomonas_salina.2